MLGVGRPKAYYCQPKKGSWNLEQEKAFRASTDIPLTIPLELFLEWNAIFKSLSTPQVWGDTRNFSLGMFAIIVAANYVGEDIVLAAFDNLLNPTLTQYQKADRGVWVSRHDWAAEHRMLPLVEKAYGVRISGLW